MTIPTYLYAAMTKRLSSAILLGCLLAAAGCDKGGLLVPESRASDGGGGKGPAAVNPQAKELVNGGNVATNAKYKMVFTVGQPTPNQGVGKGTSPGAGQAVEQRLNGGLIGATNDAK